ncbi:MAG: hypothetical protein DI533_12795 [Cereibacter sphaeroides]|uniref:MOSC domain-containing protein n=1 Tax=Cereibacter sphaeroides TaxID=1063 RepID=A0A2W5S829_CERSP|nr:MAG: hypothetical protein DI533_12795 [Cereibacter sphaeroides]
MNFATAEELSRALPDVLSAPKTDAPIKMLCFRPGFNKREFASRLRLSRRDGIIGDCWNVNPWLRLADGSADPRMQVSILPTRVLDLLWRDREGTIHPGDPIIADLDLSGENLPVGTLVRAGTAILRVSDEPNFGCVKWKARYGADALKWVANPAHAAYRLRGVLCSIEEDGELTLDDRLTVLR